MAQPELMNETLYVERVPFAPENSSLFAHLQKIRDHAQRARYGLIDLQCHLTYDNSGEIVAQYEQQRQYLAQQQVYQQRQMDFQQQMANMTKLQIQQHHASYPPPQPPQLPTLYPIPSQQSYIHKLPVIVPTLNKISQHFTHIAQLLHSSSPNSSLYDLNLKLHNLIALPKSRPFFEQFVNAAQTVEHKDHLNKFLVDYFVLNLSIPDDEGHVQSVFSKEDNELTYIPVIETELQSILANLNEKVIIPTNTLSQDNRPGNIVNNQINEYGDSTTMSIDVQNEENRPVFETFDDFQNMAIPDELYDVFSSLDALTISHGLDAYNQVISTAISSILQPYLTFLRQAQQEGEKRHTLTQFTRTYISPQLYGRFSAEQTSYLKTFGMLPQEPRTTKNAQIAPTGPYDDYSHYLQQVAGMQNGSLFRGD